MDEDLQFIKMKCSDCEQSVEDCSYHYFVEQDSKIGCSRKVPEEIAIDYWNKVVEEWPFKVKTDSIDSLHKDYEETIKTIYNVLDFPIANLIGKSGKILKSGEFNDKL